MMKFCSGQTWRALITQKPLRMLLRSSVDIDVVPKDMNPPNVPQLRLIENFWAILKKVVYDNGWEAKSERQLVTRIRKCLGETDWTSVQRMMSMLKTKIQKAADTSPRSMI